MKKTGLYITAITSFLLGSCNMSAFYANKRIGNCESFSIPNKSLGTEAEEIKTFSDRQEISIPEDRTTFSQDMVIEKPEVRKSKKVTFDYPVKEKTEPVKKESSSQGRVPHKITKGKTPMASPAWEDGIANTVWLLFGLILAAVVVGLLTHSLWIGLLIFPGIPVLFYLIILVIMLCGGFYLAD